MSNQNKKAWLVTLYSPNNQEQKLIDEEEFKNIKAFTTRINQELENFDLKYSHETIRKVAAGRYHGGEGTLQKILKVNKIIKKPLIFYQTVITR